MKLSLKDIMFIGIFSALYFLCVGLGTLIGAILFPSGNMMMAPAFTGLLAGTVYMLLIRKIKRFGAISMLGIVMAAFFFLSGHFIFSFVPNLICGLVADLVALAGKYRDKWLNLLSYVIFSFGNLAPIILMWLMRDAYIQRLLDKGKDMIYVNRVMLEFNVGNVTYLTLTIVIGATIGGLFGQYMIRKYFKKSGKVN